MTTKEQEPKSFNKLKWISLSLVISILIIFGLYHVIIFLKWALLMRLPGLLYKFRNPTLVNQQIFWRPDDMDFSISNKGKRPNIILIVADDLGINDLNGGSGVSTPNIDSLRKNGANFKNAYAGQATCAPSRAAIFTGRNPTSFGFEFTPIPMVLANIFSRLESNPIRKPIVHKEKEKEIPEMSNMVIPSNVTIIAEALKEYGYKNYLIGKWHLGHSENHTPLDRGFDETITFPVGLSTYLDPSDKRVVNGKLEGSFDLLEEFLLYNMPFSVSHNNGPQFSPDEYMTDYLTHRAVELIETKRNSNVPFFLSLTYSAPHTPLQALKDDYNDPEISKIEDNNQRVYAAMIKALDRGVGEVIQALKDNNKYEDTMIIFTSDNGGAHYIGLDKVNFPYRGWKGTFYEGGIRIPMFIQWPSVIPKQTEFIDFVSQMDIFATIKGAASGKSTNNFVEDHHYIRHEIKSESHLSEESSLQKENTFSQGVDLLYFLKNRLEVPHSEIFWRSGHYKALRHHNWKIQISERPDRVIFNNLEIDPLERINLADQMGIVTKSQLDDIFTNNENYLNDLKQNLGPDFLILLDLYKRLIEINNKQSKSLWPELIESAIPIDKTALSPMTEQDEYIYFPN